MQTREIGSWKGVHQSRGIYGGRGWGLQVRRVRRSVDGAGGGSWVSGRVGKGAFQALSMKRRSNEGNGDLRHWLMFQTGTRRRQRRKGSGVR